MAYKGLTHLNRTNKVTIEINNIENKKWIKCYKNYFVRNSRKAIMMNQKQPQPHQQKQMKSPVRNLNRD
jgi:hypothetical protein